MSLTAAVSGCLVFLLSVSVIQGQNDWRMTYPSTQVCGLKRSTVNIRCVYTFPSKIKDLDTKVKETIWFTKGTDIEPVDLKTDSEYSGRVQYSSNNNDCTLTIRDLRESDSAEYKFRFITNQPGGKVTGKPGVTLSVTDLQVEVTRPQHILYPSWANLHCQSSCPLPAPTSYIWYQNGQKIKEDRSPHYANYIYYSPDSFSCAISGYEDFPSPPVCEFTFSLSLT
ncbi:uncharacterized protein LOC131971561 [Centropristis striata]|uniref:uncharacterized protein LOC131971561 n=1 Tax=Centropristis striata TaxID=184440 RepID=UPI0027E0F88D|nr:uncharacterized protein LOC131971561 [Centropristis striata]